MVVSDLIYPFFIECISYTDDPYWKSIFEDLAHGSSPYSTYISKDVIICNYKDREFAYKIQRKPADALYKEVMDLFRQKLRLLSPSEILSNRDEMTNHYSEICNDWSLIKKKNIKESLVERYAISMKNKYSLTIQQAKYLNDIIFLSLVLRVLLPGDILINNGIIENVNGIKFEPGKVILEFNIYDIRSTVQQPEFIIDENLMISNWNKFLTTLRKLNPN